MILPGLEALQCTAANQLVVSSAPKRAAPYHTNCRASCLRKCCLLTGAAYSSYMHWRALSCGLWKTSTITGSDMQQAILREVCCWCALSKRSCPINRRQLCVLEPMPFLLAHPSLAPPSTQLGSH